MCDSAFRVTLVQTGARWAPPNTGHPTQNFQGRFGLRKPGCKSRLFFITHCTCAPEGTKCSLKKPVPLAGLLNPPFYG